MGRTRLAAVAAAVACVVLAGCSEGAPAGAAEAVRASADKTIDAGSSRVALDVSLSLGGSKTSVRGEGAFDMQNRRGVFTLDLGALGASLGGDSIETIFDGPGMYLKLPSSAPSGEPPWFKIDLATAGRLAGANLGSLGQLRQSDPTKALEFLRGATDDVRKVGDEDVRGESTTHYRAVVDLQRAAASLPAEERAAIQDLVRSLGTPRLPADVWIDDSGRVRRLRFTVDSDGKGPTAPATVSLELFDFGVPVTVDAPRADQVTDLTNLLTPPPSAPR